MREAMEQWSNPFGSETFRYLLDLKENNDRDWFQANRARYEDVVCEPALRFISDFGPRLQTVSPHFDAIPKKFGGSLFRIYRDVRFSRDKRPYKTHVGIHFRHKQHRDAHAPGFYLHLEPNNVFAGAGMWRPHPQALRAIRRLIVEDGDGWRQVTGDPGLGEELELGGESLKRAPRGFDRDHALIRDIKRKSFMAVARLSGERALAASFLDDYTGICAAASPLMRFVCRATGVPY